MKKENTAIKVSESLEKYLVKAERFNDMLTRNLEKLEQQGEKMEDSLPRITLEVEELKKTREALSSFLGEQIREAYVKESKSFSENLSRSFLEKVDQNLNDSLKVQQQQARELYQTYREKSDSFGKEMTGLIFDMKALMSLQKQRLTRKGILICLVFCTASVLTGSGLFYFFPQNIYYSDGETAKNVIMGRSAWENMKHLSAKDQTMLLDGMKKYMANK